MATLLDVGIMENFGVVFIVLLVFLVIFGLLEYIKAFGEEKRGLHSIIALMIAFLFIISKAATNMVAIMVPWFIVLAVFIFFVLFLVRIFGVGEADMVKLIKDPNVHPWIIAFSALILIFALGSTLGQTLLEKGEGITPTQPIEGNGEYYSDGGYPVNVISTQPSTTQGALSTTTDSFSTNLLNRSNCICLLLI